MPRHMCTLALGRANRLIEDRALFLLSLSLYLFYFIFKFARAFPFRFPVRLRRCRRECTRNRAQAFIYIAYCSCRYILHLCSFSLSPSGSLGTKLTRVKLVSGKSMLAITRVSHTTPTSHRRGGTRSSLPLS